MTPLGRLNVPVSSCLLLGAKAACRDGRRDPAHPGHRTLPSLSFRDPWSYSTVFMQDLPPHLDLGCLGLQVQTLAVWVPKCKNHWLSGSPSAGTSGCLASFSSPSISFSIFKKGMRVLCLHLLGENGAQQALSAAQPTAVGADVSRV